MAIHEKVDELLWSGCFYQEFQEIKKRIALVKIIILNSLLYHLARLSTNHFRLLPIRGKRMLSSNCRKNWILRLHIIKTLS